MPKSKRTEKLHVNLVFKNIIKISNQKNMTKQQKKEKEMFKKALKALDVKTIPERLLFRDEEKGKIFDYINQVYQNRGSSQSLYISGQPGIGKTACIFEVMREF